MEAYRNAFSRAIDEEQADAKHNQHAFAWMANNYMQYSGFVPSEEMYENWNEQVWENYLD